MQSHAYRRYIFRRKLVCCIRDEQAGFTHGTVTNYNTLDGLHSCDLVFSIHSQSET